MKTGKFNKSHLRSILVLSLLLLCFSAAHLDAQQKNEHTAAIIADKVFPFFACLEKNPEALKIIREDPDLAELNRLRKERVELALKRCEDTACLAEAVRWTPSETDAIGNLLAKMTRESEPFKEAVSTLKASGHYNLYASLPDPEFTKAAWSNVSGGANHILDVYLEGKKPFYAAIDSISFSVDDREFLAGVKNRVAGEVKHLEGNSFFEFTKKICVNALLMNRRDEAARYEPLTRGINKSTFDSLKNIKWGNYPYSLILVPGSGPEDEGVAIDPQSIVRCRLAVNSFKEGAAPVIVVSGGHVHPNQTPFCEAVEMKKYLTKELNIPENVIFIEPHARHTTTNMRNTARMIYRFDIPDDKKVLIVTDPIQNAFLNSMEKRFMTELGCVPYRDLRKLNETTSEFYPDRNALQCNPSDPLDP